MKRQAEGSRDVTQEAKKQARDVGEAKSADDRKKSDAIGERPNEGADGALMGVGHPSTASMLDAASLQASIARIQPNQFGNIGGYSSQLLSALLAQPQQQNVANANSNTSMPRQSSDDYLSLTNQNLGQFGFLPTQVHQLGMSPHSLQLLNQGQLASNFSPNSIMMNQLLLAQMAQPNYQLLLQQQRQLLIPTSVQHTQAIQVPEDTSSTKRQKGIPLALPSDEANLSAYQVFIRRQIEVFEADDETLASGAQGRNRPVKVGQVGVRCIHCANLKARQRPRGAVYFPSRLTGIYQASQNMQMNHFTGSCHLMPEKEREFMMELKDQRATSVGGGKQYWISAARVLGIYESEDGLRLKK